MTTRLPGIRSKPDALAALAHVKIPFQGKAGHRLKEAMTGAVSEYYELTTPSELAAAVRRARKDPAAQASKTLVDLLPVESIHPVYNPNPVPLPDQLVRSRRRVFKGGRCRIETQLIAETNRGYPGRDPEKVLVSLLAAAWVDAGGTVTQGGSSRANSSLSPFEKFVEDVFVALLIDHKASAVSLVRAHIEVR